jgi:hypothetical protein
LTGCQMMIIGVKESPEADTHVRRTMRLNRGAM